MGNVISGNSVENPTFSLLFSTRFSTRKTLLLFDILGLIHSFPPPTTNTTKSLIRCDRRKHMRIYISTEDLNAGISVISKALPSRTAMPILEGIYAEAQGNSLLLRCNDLSLQIETILPATVEKEGSLVFPGRLFSDLARRQPDEQTLIETDKTTVTMKSGRARATMQAFDAAEYHSIPFSRQEFFVNIKKSTFKNMIRQTIFATAQDETKPILTGVLLEITDGLLSMVALDGYRLALRREAVEGVTGEQKVVVPAKSLLEISRILDDSNDEIKVVFSKTHLLIDLEHTKITTRLLEGEFIKYKQILPENHSTCVRVNRQELLDSIDRVSLIAREGKSNLIKFSFSGETLAISANSEAGKSNEELTVSVMGSELEIAFNAKYVSDVLKALDDDEIFLEMNSSISPCVVKPVQGDRFYFLILPVRLFSGL